MQILLLKSFVDDRHLLIRVQDEIVHESWLRAGKTLLHEDALRRLVLVFLLALEGILD